MKRRHKATFVTIVPSPYQRDLFAALAARDDIELDVYYMESESPDSPWPEKPLRSFERIMPGFWVPFGRARGHVNWGLPDSCQSDVTVLSSFTSLTGQYLMRGALRKRPWIFWGALRRSSGSDGRRRMTTVDDFPMWLISAYRITATSRHSLPYAGIGTRPPR